MPRYGPGQTVAPPKKRPQAAPSPEDLRPQQPRQRRQPVVQAPSPEDIRQPKPSFTSPSAPPVRGKPVPVLQGLGYHGSIEQFGERLAHVVDAHLQRFGHKPSPGFALDLARSPVADIGHLFDATPQSDRVARLKPLTTSLQPQQPGDFSDEGALKQMQRAVESGTYSQWFEQNHDLVSGLLSNPALGKRASALAFRGALQGDTFDPFDPAQQGELAAGSRKAGRQRDFYERRAKAYREAGKIAQEKGGLAAHQHLQAMGFVPGGPGKVFDNPITRPLALGVGQIVTALAYSPAGIYHTGGAVKGDVGAALGGDLSFKRSRGIGVQTFEAIKRDFSHPSENPGYLLMDVLGIASAGAGTALRVGRAGSLLSEGEVGGATRALLTRPVGGTYTLSKGDTEEHVLLFENPIAQVIQRASLNLRQRALDRRHETTGGRQPVTSGTRFDLSSEAKLGREAETRKRTERAIAETYLRDVEKAAGWSAVSAEVFKHFPLVVRNAAQKLPGKAPHGLTRGEQKAIQVLATDDANPLALHRDFHERMIQTPELGEVFGIGPEQFVKNHERHLADLKLAQKVLQDLQAGKSRKRFNSAVAATNRLVDQMQAIKINELGLLPDTAERRIIAPADVMRQGVRLEDTAKLQKEITRLEESGAQPGRLSDLRDRLEVANQRTEAFQRASEESFYLPFVPKRYAKKTALGGLMRRATAGPYGIPLSRDLPELSHVFTGRSIIAGDFRIDATSLAGEAYGRTVRAASVLSDHKRLLAASTPNPRSEFDVPIRTVEGVTPELRETLAKIDSGEFTAADAALLDPNQLDAILADLYPNPQEGIEGVRWVDGRLVGDPGTRIQQGRVVSRSAQQSPAAEIASVINEPFRLSYLFLRPAYALNLLGNTGMSLIHQGIYAPLNLGRALYAPKLYGGDVARALDALVGEGKMASIGMRSRGGQLMGVSGKFAHAFSVLTDRHFRRAALIHELRRQGFRTPEQIRSALFDDTNMTKLVEAKKRANKAMVEFDNLTWYEKNVIRHYVFVYPWVSRSAVWSVRTMIEHPIQSAVLIQLGHQAQEDEDPIFKHAPDWVKRIGYVPIGYKADGSPRLLNVTSINSFSTLSDMLALAEGAEVPEDFSSPVVEIGIHAITQRDQYGQKYANRFTGPLTQPVQQIPLVRAITGPKEQKPLKPVDVTDRKTLLAHERSALKQSVIQPDLWGNWGRYAAGGLAPSVLNLPASEARYWQNAPLAKRTAHERQLMQEAVRLQGELLKQPVPARVKTAVNLASAMTFRRAQEAAKIGRDLTVKERALSDIGTLGAARKLTSPEVAAARRQLNKILDPDKVRSFVTKLYDVHAGGAELRQWQSDVNTVASFTPAMLKQQTETLAGAGLASPNMGKGASQEALHELGRRYVAFLREVRKRKAGKDPRNADFAAQMRVFQDEHDQPVKIGDKTFPSIVRLAWANQTPDERMAHLHSITGSYWKSLSAFDKELLGRPSSATVTQGWLDYQKVLDEAKAKLPPGQSYPSAYKVTVAKYIDRYYAKGFYKDFLFARQPAYQRLPMLKTIQNSPNKPTWDQIFEVARGYGKYLKNDNYSKTAIRDAWRRYVDTSLQPWAEEDPAFKRELQMYKPTLLKGLLN